MYQSGSVSNMAALALRSAPTPIPTPDLKRYSRDCPITKLGAVPPEVRERCPKQFAVAEWRVDQADGIQAGARLCIRLDDNNVGMLYATSTLSNNGKEPCRQVAVLPHLHRPHSNRASKIACIQH